MKTTVHIIWGKHAVALYKARRIDASVTLAHAAYDFFSHEAANGFRQGISAASDPAEWIEVSLPGDIVKLGRPVRQRLIDAVKKGDVRTVEVLLSLGVNPDGPDGNGMTALLYSCQLGHRDITLALLHAGADPNKKQDGGKYATPLHYACALDDVTATSLVEELINEGASPHTTDVHGNRPLHIASRHDNAAAVCQLLVHGARPGDQNDFGETALDVSDGDNGVELLLKEAQERQNEQIANSRNIPKYHPAPTRVTE